MFLSASLQNTVVYIKGVDQAPTSWLSRSIAGKCVLSVALAVLALFCDFLFLLSCTVFALVVVWFGFEGFVVQLLTFLPGCRPGSRLAGAPRRTLNSRPSPCRLYRRSLLVLRSDILLGSPASQCVPLHHSSRSPPPLLLLAFPSSRLKGDILRVA